MNPTKDQYALAARFCGVEPTDKKDYKGDELWFKPGSGYLLWNPLTWQDGGPLLSKVEKWLGDVFVKMNIVERSRLPAIGNAYLDYAEARSSGDSQQWLEAGFRLCVAIQESVG